jgi:molybdopterin-containing oxidoreductase family iron-sulfur binding subunit
MRKPKSSAPQRSTRRGLFASLGGAPAHLAPQDSSEAPDGEGEDELEDEEQREPQPWQQTADGHTPRWGMAIDLDACTGCGGCVVSCKVENNVPMTGREDEDAGTTIEWMTMGPATQGERTNLTAMDLLPMPCMHCDDAPCTKVCPVNATYVSPEGLVAQIWDRCIGCRYCQVACPYSRRYFNWEDPETPESLCSMQNPDVAVRPAGIVEKCTFCHHRIRDKRHEVRREGRPITDGDFQRLPACAEDCPTNAITFGDLDEPGSRVSQLAESPRAQRLLEGLGTEPKVYYLSRNPIEAPEDLR